MKTDSDSFETMSWKQFLSGYDPSFSSLGKEEGEKVIDGAHQLDGL